jgi:hypothetical protein
MGYEVEGALPIVQVAFEHQTNTPSHVTIKFHDCFLKDSPLSATRDARRTLRAGRNFGVILMAGIVIEVRDSEHIASTLDDHEVARVFVFGYSELHIILPAHDKTRTMPSDHVRVARTCVMLASCILQGH